MSDRLEASAKHECSTCSSRYYGEKAAEDCCRKRVTNGGCGCPTCGGSITAIVARGPSTHEIHPCGHDVAPLTARDLVGDEDASETRGPLIADGGHDPLEDMSDEELGQLVRGTAAFRAAAACARFAQEARELRENDALAYDRLIWETHDRQPSSVTKRDTTAEIVDTFLRVIEDHAELAEHPADAAERAAEEAIEEGDRDA